MSRADRAALDAMMDEIDSDTEQDETNFRKNSNNKNKNNFISDNKNISDISYSQSKSSNYYSSISNNNVDGKEIKENQLNQFKLEQEINNFGNFSVENTQNDAKKTELYELKRWVMRPCRPNEAPIKCFVERVRSGLNMLNPIYRLYLEPNTLYTDTAEAKNSAVSPLIVSGNPVPGARFLMFATKQQSSKTSSYLFSCDNNSTSVDDRGSEYILGKLKSNAVGSQYIIVDNGRSPLKATGPSTCRKEYCVVRFVFDSGGPSVIEAWVPSVNASASIVSTWQPNTDEQSMNAYVNEFMENRNNNSTTNHKKSCIVPSNYDKLFMLRNKKPKWDDAHGGHVLNFRVSYNNIFLFFYLSVTYNFVS
jgi:hypothetical protein